MHFSTRWPPTTWSVSERLPQLIFAARVFAVGTTVPMLMRLPLSRLARILEPPRRCARAVDDPEAIDRTLSAVDGALRRGRPLVREGCLTRGVARYWFLRRAGVDVALVFGTGRVGDHLEAHCWLSLDGETLREPDNGASFSELVRICSPGVLQAGR